jgi:hypothetical protein
MIAATCRYARRRKPPRTCKTAANTPDRTSQCRTARTRIGYKVCECTNRHYAVGAVAAILACRSRLANFVGFLNRHTRTSTRTQTRLTNSLSGSTHPGHWARTQPWTAPLHHLLKLARRKADPCDRSCHEQRGRVACAHGGIESPGGLVPTIEPAAYLHRIRPLTRRMRPALHHR